MILPPSNFGRGGGGGGDLPWWFYVVVLLMFAGAMYGLYVEGLFR